MGQDQRERAADAGGGQLGEIEVLDHEDAVFDVEDLRNPERAVGILGGNRPAAPGVTAGERNVPVGEPLREPATRPGLARQVALRSFQWWLQPVWKSTASPGSGSIEAQ